MTLPTAFVCEGKKCSRTCDHDALLRGLSKVSDVHLVRCQKICHGSVVGVPLDGKLQWFERIDTAKLCVHMKRAARAGRRRDLAAPLKKRRLKKLAGRAPRR